MSIFSRNHFARRALVVNLDIHPPRGDPNNCIVYWGGAFYTNFLVILLPWALRLGGGLLRWEMFGKPAQLLTVFLRVPIGVASLWLLYVVCIVRVLTKVLAVFLIFCVRNFVSRLLTLQVLAFKPFRVLRVLLLLFPSSFLACLSDFLLPFVIWVR